MKIKEELLHEIKDLKANGQLQEARILSGYVHLLKEIFKDERFL